MSDKTPETPECAFARALRTAQETCGYIVPEDSKNPHFGSKYASHAAVLRRAIPAAAAEGLTLRQSTRIEGETVILVSVLSHDRGYSVTSEWPVARVTEKPQALGSALTYARRYQAVTLFGLSADEDDDGNTAQRMAEKKPKAAKQRSDAKPESRKSGDTAHARERARDKLTNYVREFGTERVRGIVGPRADTAPAMWAQVNKLKKELGDLDEPAPPAALPEELSKRAHLEAEWFALATEIGMPLAKEDLAELYGATSVEAVLDRELAIEVERLKTKAKEARR